MKLGFASRVVCLTSLAGLVLSTNGIAEQVGQVVHLDRTGSLVYEVDDRGNRLPDFSHAGYMGGGVPLPEVGAVVRVSPVDGDDTARLQAAIDHVSGLPAGPDGWRGAVLLEAGTFEVSESLFIRDSGVVLRGHGSGEDGTILLAIGPGRYTLLRILGDASIDFAGEAVAIKTPCTVGATSVELADASGFSKGDRIRVFRPSTMEWIEEVGMDTAPARTPYKWKPGTVDLAWHRVVESTQGNTLVLDAPLTSALDDGAGSGTVQRIDSMGRITQVGIEHLRMVSSYDRENPKDENHPWMAVELDHVENAWIDDLTGVHFVSSIVDVGVDCRAITVSNCRSLEPVSEDGGYRRHAFHSSGELVLFNRCYSEYGRCDFTTGYQTAGPVVFLDCEARHSSGRSGSLGSWSSGILFDNVTIDGGQLALDNLEIRFGGAGWSAANSILWQCSASQIVVQSPPGARNWGVGVWGEFYGDGRWQQSNEFVTPQSLYLAQLRERLGQKAVLATKDRQRCIDNLDVIPVFEEVVPAIAMPVVEEKHPMTIRNGWLTDPDGLMTGGRSPVSWWRGNLAPARTRQHNAALTRFLPGRYGQGATDDLHELAKMMKARSEIQLRHHYGLWYDRRREDHQMIRRHSNDVWPPFFEQPYARSGRGIAWDGLSKYDLERFNPWYFSRLEQFAEIAGTEGLVLVNEMFFQHNIIESGAHWVDCPWRPVNNINDTPFPEPPPFTGDTVKIGNMFYDVENDKLRAIHKAYIRQCLANLSGQSNVIHTTGDEFTGPLHFVEFWLDTIIAWTGEGNPDPVVALSVTKDVQDAILKDPAREPAVDVIEIKYWFNTAAGLFTPAGGEELAPRQHLRKWKGGRSTPRDVAMMIRDYREAFPDKAIICSEIAGLDGWAVLAGGGSLPNLPPTLDNELRRQLPDAKVINPPLSVRSKQWTLGQPGEFYFIYSLDGDCSLLDLRGHPGAYSVHSIDPSTGQLHPSGLTMQGDELVEIKNNETNPSLFWIKRQSAP
ncbi:MAG: DUF6298 domain-containing protein [Puniceicoccaceae bacterium]